MTIGNRSHGVTFTIEMPGQAMLELSPADAAQLIATIGDASARAIEELSQGARLSESLSTFRATHSDGRSVTLPIADAVKLARALTDMLATTLEHFEHEPAQYRANPLWN